MRSLPCSPSDYLDEKPNFSIHLKVLYFHQIVFSCKVFCNAHELSEPKNVQSALVAVQTVALTKQVRLFIRFDLSKTLFVHCNSRQYSYRQRHNSWRQNIAVFLLNLNIWVFIRAVDDSIAHCSRTCVLTSNWALNLFSYVGCCWDTPVFSFAP